MAVCQLFVCCAVLTVTLASSASGPFSGHKVVRITPQDERELDLLNRLLSQRPNLDIWKESSCTTCSVDIRLSPFEYDDIITGLHHHGFRPEVLISDVQGVINQQKNTLKFRPKMIGFDYGQYHTLEDIYNWIQNISNVYKSVVSVYNITMSYEGRPLMGIKISTPSPFPKAAFFFEGGIHAREWISPATVLYMAGQMLDGYEKDPDITKMVDMFDWYILPVTNPDGYKYTWQSYKDVDGSFYVIPLHGWLGAAAVTTRLWRKTRSKHGLCVGVDPNRNWDIEWCKTGASRDPCSDTYCGPSAFSEVEVKGVADYLSTIKNLRAFIDFHSYSQLWMTPWGYTKKLPADFKQIDAGAAVACEALEKIFGTKYQHGSIAQIIYKASGSSADYTYGKLNVKYSYAVELRDTGKRAFLLPADQIIPSGKETLEALMALATYVYNNK